MAAVPFGFSFGDLVAAVEIIHKAAQALRRSAGAQNQFRQAAADLESLEMVLKRVQALGPTITSPETLAAIQLYAYTCQLPLRQFTQRIKEYERHLSPPHDTGAHVLNDIKVGYWNVKWALQVESDVAKLKAAIGPGLTAISLLLQVESLESNAASQTDLKHVARLVQHATILNEQTWSALKTQAITVNRIDLTAANTTSDSRKILQSLPLLASRCQIHGLAADLDKISAKVDIVATKDQANQLTAALRDNDSKQQKYHLESLTIAKSCETHVLETGQKVDNIQNLMAVILAILSAQSEPVTAQPSGQSASVLPTTASSADGTSSRCDNATPSVSALRPAILWLRETLRRVLCSMIVLLTMFPNVVAQLRTCMTFIRHPMLLSGNSIALTDALNRTKLLPYEYFCSWNLLEPWLQRSFQNLPGESRVARGKFAMFKQFKSRTGPEIPVSQWERCVFAGDEIVMSMLVDFESSESQCRRCDTSLPDDDTDEVWRTCIVCKQSYYYTKVEDAPSGLPPSPLIEAYHHEASHDPSSTSVEAKNDRSHISEDDKFARVHSLRPQRTCADSGIKDSESRSDEEVFSEPLLKAVRFAPRSSAQVSRPATPQEAWPLYHFEIHARECQLCGNGSLCDDGYSLSQDVRVLIHQQGGEFYSTRVDREGNRNRVEIPYGYTQARTMLGILQNSEKKQAPIISYGRQSRPTRQREPRKIVSIEPVRRHRPDRDEVVEVTPSYRYETGEAVQLPRIFNKLSSYDGDVGWPRREYHVEDRTPRGRDREWREREKGKGGERGKDSGSRDSDR